MANWNACVVYSLCVRGNRAQRLKHHVKHNNSIGPDFRFYVVSSIVPITMEWLVNFIAAYISLAVYDIQFLNFIVFNLHQPIFIICFRYRYHFKN